MSNQISPFLTHPHIQYQKSYIQSRLEFMEEGRNPPWNLHMLEDRFGEYVDTLLANETDPLPDRVPETAFWLIIDEQFAGEARIRHHLTDALLQYGGHIGYDIRPSMRKRGFGTLQCRLALHEAYKIGIKSALITCDDDNIGSIKIIEANGGILENTVDNGRLSLTRRYWVPILTEL